MCREERQKIMKEEIERGEPFKAPTVPASDITPAQDIHIEDIESGTASLLKSHFKGKKFSPKIN